MPRQALALLEATPTPGRRADVTLLLGRVLIDVGRPGDAIALLEATTFTNREGDTGSWRVFSRAHIERGRQRLEQGSVSAALQDFEAALTYPANLNAGRPYRPHEARAQYWRGQALEAQGQTAAARAAYEACAGGAELDDEQRDFIARCSQRLGQITG